MVAPFALPQGLAWLTASADGRDWLERLPALVAEVAADWRLTLGPPYPDGNASLALPVRTGTGGEAVLKLQLPDAESRFEAAALRAWHGDGAVLLLDADPERRALLLERCTPGAALLAEPPGTVLDVLTGLLPRLWIAPPPEVTSLAAECAGWAATLEESWDRAGRTLPRPVLDAALAALDELPRTQGEPVLLNQDLHAGNVLAAGREPWLVIDPKPLSGEREFGPAPVLRDVARRDLGSLVPALDRISRDLGLDRERVRRWTIAQTVAWAFDGAGVDPVHAAVARMLLAA